MITETRLLPVQFAGIGDIIFEQTLIRRLCIDRACTGVTWPVLPQFIDGLNAAYPDISFVDMSLWPIDYEEKSERVHTIGGAKLYVLPLRWADQICNVPYWQCMQSKYMMYGMDWQEWKLNAKFRRNRDKEHFLFERVLGLQRGEKYTLINDRFRSDNSGHCKVPMMKGKVVKMSSIAGYSLFDWSFVIENAAEIHTVSTSILYLIELLKPKGVVHLYPRKPDENDFRNVDYLFTNKYELHL